MENNKLSILAEKCLECKKPRCMEGCPIHTRINLINHYLKQGMIEEAKNIQEEDNPLSFVCGALCDHERQCLGSCVRRDVKVPTNEICSTLGLIRLHEEGHKSLKTGKKVVIVGGGPAGMAASYELLKKDCNVIIYEKESALGGVLNLNMPDFRYDETLIKVFAEKLVKMGLEVHLNAEFGKEVHYEDIKDADALVFATGASIPKRLFDSNLALDALEVLKEAKENKLGIENKTAIVLGGGNTAYDVARVLNKAHNKTSIVYRRDIKNSPASLHEISLAMSEGVIVEELLQPLTLVEENGVKKLHCERTALFDDGGSRLNFKGTGEFVDLTCDYVIESIGASCDLSYLKEIDANLLNKYGYTDEICNGNIYVIGDAYYGPQSFVKAAKSAKVAVKDILNEEN